MRGAEAAGGEEQGLEDLWSSSSIFGETVDTGECLSPLLGMM